jgi:hypothetical protein
VVVAVVEGLQLGQITLQLLPEVHTQLLLELEILVLADRIHHLLHMLLQVVVAQVMLVIVVLQVLWLQERDTAVVLVDRALKIALLDHIQR